MSAEAGTVVQQGASLSDVIRLRVNRDKLKAVVTNLTTERDEAVKAKEKVEKAFESYKTQAENSPLKKQVDELKQKLRTFEHRKTFDELAAERGVTDEAARDILYEKSGWTADKDEFDADEMAAAIENQKEALPFLFGKPAEANGTQAKPGPARGQGNPGKKTSVDPAIIEDDDPRMNDPVWQMRNQDKLVASSKAKIARGDTDPSRYQTATQSVDGLSTR